MTAKPSPTSRAKKKIQTLVPKRTFTGASGAFLGAIGMSVIAGVLVTAGLTPVVAMAGATANTAIDLFENLPDHLGIDKLAQPSTLYSTTDSGELVKIASFYAQDRVEVEWNDISQYAKDAAVATEDPRFYSHGGVDLLATSRAVVSNALGQDVSGASTITMQYVRNVLIQAAEAKLDKKERKAAYDEAMRQTADRKLKEMRLAIGIEKKYSKDEILQGYLNIALFGRQIYGIESAASYYYGTNAKDLTLAQAASLIAIVNNPSVLQIDIPENIEANTARRDRILGDMLNRGKITQAQYDEAVATPVEPKITPKASGCSQAGFNGSFCDYVTRYILRDKNFGKTEEERFYHYQSGGYKIITTLDAEMQQAAIDTIQRTVPPTTPGIDIGAAAVSVGVGTGKVLTMAQNRPYSDVPEDLAADPGLTAINYSTDFEDGGSTGFQVGSTYKPITLSEWIRTGHSYMDLVNVNGRTVQMQSFKDSCNADGVAGYGPFTFTNDNLGTRGSQTVRTGVAQSVNGAFVSMAQKMDLCDIKKMAEALGIHRADGDPLKGNLSSVYGGTDEIAPITMAAAYATFASGGKYCTPVPIEKITDSSGAEVKFTKSKCKQAIEPRVAAGVAATLEYNVQSGLGRHARSAIGIPHIAKTGTTDDVVDNWTVGASTKVATAVWVGNVTGKVGMRVGSSLQVADMSIWPAIMNVADRVYGGEPFAKADSKATTVQMAALPDVAGKSFADAKRLLEEIGFTVTDGGDTDSDRPAGVVAKTEPGGGTNVPAGSEVRVFKSNASMSAVPGGTTGVPFATAKATLNGAGFSNVVAACTVSTKTLPGNYTTLVVASAAPASGAIAKRSDVVTLAVPCP